MTGFVRDDRTGIAVDPRRVAAYRRAAAAAVGAGAGRTDAHRSSQTCPSYRLGQDLAGARGAALALAYERPRPRRNILPTASDDRRRRATTLRGTVLPVLGSAGLGHLGALIEVALAHEGDPARKAAGVETKQ